MATQHKPQVLVIGAGSMGAIVGYHLSLAGAGVTFLVRAHRAKQLDRPQLLYCYDDKKLKEFKDFSYFTDPAKIIGAKYDYIVITLDSAALRNDTGKELVRTIGEAARGTDTKVILGSVFINLLPWFLETSGLSAKQVTNGPLGILAYPTTATELVQSSQQDLDLITKADQAYTGSLGFGMQLDDSSPEVANAFTELYNASGVSRCIVTPAAQLALFTTPLFAALAAFDLLGWPKIKDINVEDETWKLGTDGVKEIRGLSIHGEAGQQAAAATTSANLAEMLAGIEKQVLPLDFQAFNRFHHGGKVNLQDCELLRACVRLGEAEGKTMSAVKELLNRLETR